MHPQLGIELAGAIQGGEVVEAADMLAVDEDLRHASAPAGASQHLVALGRVFHDVDVDVRDALLLEQALGPRTIGAEHRAVDFDAGHDLLYPVPCSPRRWVDRSTEWR